MQVQISRFKLPFKSLTVASYYFINFSKNLQKKLVYIDSQNKNSTRSIKLPSGEYKLV